MDFLNTFFEHFGLTGGVLIILGAGIVIFLIVAIIAERKTKLLFPNRAKKQDEEEDDSFSFDFLDFDDDDEQDSSSK